MGRKVSSAVIFTDITRRGAPPEEEASYNTLNHTLKSGKVPTIAAGNMKLSSVGSVIDALD